MQPCTCSRDFSLNKDGNVGVGTGSPSQKLHVVGSVQGDGFVTNSGRRLEVESEEHGAAIKEHDAAINDLRRRRRLEENASDRIEKLDATIEKMAKRIEMLEAELEKLSKK